MLKSHYEDIAQNQDTHWWYMGMIVINESLLNTFLSKGEKAKILDAGCGPGAMLPLLQKYGDVIGVDISEEALKYAKKRGKVIKGDIMKLDFKDNTFDLVVCMDVLYHMWVKDETKALKEFNRVLKKDGILLLREPAYNWLRGNEDRGSLTARRFSKMSISKNLANCGFRIVKLTYANFFLFPLVLMVRLVGSLKPKSKQGQSDFFILPTFVNQLLYSFLKTERFLMRFVSLPFGSSLICVAKKV